MRKCECGREIKGTYLDHCEDCYANSQPYWGDFFDDPLIEEPDGLALELVPA